MEAEGDVTQSKKSLWPLKQDAMLLALKLEEGGYEPRKARNAALESGEGKEILP